MTLDHALPCSLPPSAVVGATIYVERLGRERAAVKLLTRSGMAVELAVCASRSLAEVIARALHQANPACELRGT